MSLSRRQLLAASAATLAVGQSSNALGSGSEDVVNRSTGIEIPVIDGVYRELIAANPVEQDGLGLLASVRSFLSRKFGLGNAAKWYTNDHYFVEDADGRLHWFGINNPFPPEGKELYR